MRKRNPQTLLLIELMVCMLLLCAASGLVVKLFGAAKLASLNSRELSFATTNATSFCEAFEAANGNAEKFCELSAAELADIDKNGFVAEIRYDKDFNRIQSASCEYSLRLTAEYKENGIISAQVGLYDTQNKAIHAVSYSIFVTE